MNANARTDRLLAVFALVSSLASPGRVLAKPSDQVPFPGRELNGFITVTIGSSRTWVEEENPDVRRSASVQRSARHDVRFTNENASPGSPAGVITVRGHEVSFSASVRDVSETVDDRSQQRYVSSASGTAGLTCPAPPGAPLAVLCSDGAVYIVIDPAEKAYYFTFNSIPVSCTGTDRYDTLELELPGFKVGPIPLPAKHQPLAGSRTFLIEEPEPMGPGPRKRHRGGALAPGSALMGVDSNLMPLEAVVSWNFEQIDLQEVTAEIAGYDAWMPKGNLENPAKSGNDITVRAWVHEAGKPEKKGKEATFTFEIRESSAEKGVCINAPRDGGTEDDLQILEQRNPKLDPVGAQATAPSNPSGPRRARSFKTRSPVPEASVTVSSFDFGAYGSIRITARDKDGKELRVRFRDKMDTPILLPKDENGNRIADSWEAEKGVEGYAATWDDAEAPGQTARGDGLTLYEKYRGVAVLQGSEVARIQLPPREKAHFVVDPAGVFDLARWQTTTGVRAYRLDDKLVPGGSEQDPESRRVNFNSSGETTGHKYAVRLTVVQTAKEPDPLPKQNGDPGTGVEPTQYAYTTDTSTPRGAERCRVFPARVRDMIDRVIARMTGGWDEPRIPGGRRGGRAARDARHSEARHCPSAGCAGRRRAQEAGGQDGRPERHPRDGARLRGAWPPRRHGRGKRGRTTCRELPDAVSRSEGPEVLRASGDARRPWPPV